MCAIAKNNSRFSCILGADFANALVCVTTSLFVSTVVINVTGFFEGFAASAWFAIFISMVIGTNGVLLTEQRKSWTPILNSSVQDIFFLSFRFSCHFEQREKS